MTKRAAKGGSGQEPRVSAEALRGHAATLYAAGKGVGEVSAELGITERQARRYKADVAPVVRAAAAATIDAVAKGAADVREEVAEHARPLARNVIDAAAGRLRQLNEDGNEGPIERDPAMVNARVRAALGGLSFIVGTKLDANVTVGLSDEKRAALIAILGGVE